MILALSVGFATQFRGRPDAGHRQALTVGMCFLWPTIEALVSEGEDATGLPRAVALQCRLGQHKRAGSFGGGTLVEKFGFRTIFFLPIAILITQLALTLRLEKHANDVVRAAGNEPAPATNSRPAPGLRPPNQGVSSAWRGSRTPFAYIAIKHIHPHAANRGGALSPLAHVRGICMFVVVFCCGSVHLSRYGTGRTGITGFAGL